MSEIAEDLKAIAREVVRESFQDPLMPMWPAIARALANERVRCALIAETHPKHRWGGWSGDPTCHAIGAAIRDGSIQVRNPSPNTEETP